MKILNISSDSSILDSNSEVAKRIIEYSRLVDRYCVIVSSLEKKKVNLSDKVIVYSYKVDSKRFFSRISGLYKAYKLGKELISKYGYDVITTQDPFETALVGLLLRNKRRIALNIQEHGDFFSSTFWRDENFINFVRYYFGQFLIKRADSIRVVSERIKLTLVERYSIESNKIIKVPIYVDIQGHKDTLPGKSVIEKYKNKFVFITLARFVKQKNLPLMISAFKQVLDQKSEAILFVIGKGPLRTELSEIISKNNLEKNVILLDWVDDVYMYYNSAQAYVLSSNYEGWGMVIIEAASTGLPIIMTDVGCAGEVIKNEENGLVIPIGDKEKLAKAMIKVIKDKDLREKLGTNSRKAVESLPGKEETLALYKKSWEKAIENYENTNSKR
jgi:glycosyltransferase involved in cell wall biosynthesis